MTDAERIRELEEEVAHWKRVALEPDVVLAPSPGGVTMTMRHVIVCEIAQAMASFLGDAPNYTTAELHHPTKGRLIITVRRASGKSPEDLADEYRSRLEALGVTDLAPLPPPSAMHQPSPVHEPHLWVNAVAQQMECRGCGATSPLQTPMRGERFGMLLQAFSDLHRGCCPKEPG